MVRREQFCCDIMFETVMSKDKKTPINFSLSKIGSNRFDMEYVDEHDPGHWSALEEDARDAIDFCPFCGKNISIFGEKSEKWKERSYICGSFRRWFAIGKDGACKNTPTPMFKYEPKENQFYMHYRKGFGEGWIPITYCIYCGEPLSEMVEKYGIPEVIADRLDPSEWQGRYKLCRGKKIVTEEDQLPDELSI